MGIANALDDVIASFNKSVRLMSSLPLSSMPHPLPLPEPMPGPDASPILSFFLFFDTLFVDVGVVESEGDSDVDGSSGGADDVGVAAI
jgi:hypothetical protein